MDTIRCSGPAGSTCRCAKRVRAAAAGCRPCRCRVRLQMRSRLESRLLAFLPFDAATDARPLHAWHRRSAQQRLARRAQICTVHRQLVAGPAGIELPTVRELSLAIEQKEL